MEPLRFALTVSVEPLDLLKDYPKIQNHISENWGTLRLKVYLENLLTDTRGGTRQGFSPEAYGAIVSLSLANAFELEKGGLTLEEPPEKDFALSKWDLPKNF